MKKVYIDGSKFKTELEFHNFIAKELEFPDYYGKNLDALWDCLSTDVVGPFEIELIHFDQFSSTIGSERAGGVLKVIRLLEIERADDFKFTLKN